MRLLRLGHSSSLLEALARLEQVESQVRFTHVGPETVDQAVALDDGAAGLPKRAPLLRTQLHLSLTDQAQRAGLGFDPAHASSVDAGPAQGIRPGTDFVAAFYGAASATAAATRGATSRLKTLGTM